MPTRRQAITWDYVDPGLRHMAWHVSGANGLYWQHATEYSAWWWGAVYEFIVLNHWGQVTYICVSKISINDSGNGLSPARRQAIIWTNAGIWLSWTLGTNVSEILREIHTVSFKKMHLRMSSAKWRQFCLGLNVLTRIYLSQCNRHAWLCCTRRGYGRARFNLLLNSGN